MEAPLLHGHATKFVADEEYGFDRLRVGDAVRPALTQGGKGPQVSTVHRVGKHHPVP